MQTAAAPPAEFEFVTGTRPDQLKGGSTRRLRSYLSRRAWQVHHNQEDKQQALDLQALRLARLSSTGGRQLIPKASSSSSSESLPRTSAAAAAPAPPKSRRRRQKPQFSITFECREDAPGGRDDGRSITAHQQAVTEGSQALVRQGSSPWDSSSPSSSSSIDYILGGGRVDPFRSYATTWQPFVPALVDHYIMHMAVDIPELDQVGNKGLLRSRWFRMVVSDTAAFPVVMLLAAANLVTVKTMSAKDLGIKEHMNRLKLNAIQCINEVFANEKSRISDGAIGAVAKMASFEAMHGDVDSYRMHMDGLKRMIDMRGGLNSLGLGGLLRRIVIWIDLNSAFLFHIPRYYPGQTFAGEESQEPNPERFIAV